MKPWTAQGALEVERPSPFGWGVVGHDGTVRFTCTFYANHADGTYAAVDQKTTVYLTSDAYGRIQPLLATAV